MEFDFSENTVVESIEKVPADFRGLYVQGEDGKYVLGSEHEGVKSAVAAVTRLNNTLKAARAEAKAAKGKKVDLSPLSQYGESPEAIAAKFQEELEAAQAAAKANGDQDLQRQIEKIKADLSKVHSGDLEKRDKRIQALTGQLYGRMVTSEAKSALGEAGVIDVDLALPFVEKQVKVEEEDGEFRVYVVDAAGDVRYSGATGSPMTVRELAQEMKQTEKFAPLFRSEAPRGGGTPPGSTGRRVAGEPRDLSPVQKIAAGLGKNQHSRGRA